MTRDEHLNNAELHLKKARQEIVSLEARSFYSELARTEIMMAQMLLGDQARPYRMALRIIETMEATMGFGAWWSGLAAGEKASTINRIREVIVS